MLGGMVQECFPPPLPGGALHQSPLHALSGLDARASMSFLFALGSVVFAMAGVLAQQAAAAEAESAAALTTAAQPENIWGEGKGEAARCLGPGVVGRKTEARGGRSLKTKRRNRPTVARRRHV